MATNLYTDLESPNASSGIEAIADTVAHVRFVGTDWASDEVVLMKMLQVNQLHWLWFIFLGFTCNALVPGWALREQRGDC
jgi:hypothetical protein